MTATAQRTISFAAFIFIGIAVGLLALWLGSAAADTPPALAGSAGSAMAIGSGAAVAMPPIVVDDAGGIARSIYDAALAGKYKIGVGFLLMLIVFGLRNYALRWIPQLKTRLGGILLACSTAVLAVIGLALASDAPVQFGPIMNALGTALTAAGAWEWSRDLIAKRLPK